MVAPRSRGPVVARTRIGRWRPIYVIGSRRAKVQAALFNMRGGHNGFAVEAGFFKDPMVWFDP